LKDFK